MRSKSDRILERASIAWTVGVAILLALPVAVAVFGAFSDSECYGQRSEGAALEGSSALFSYVLEQWGSTLVFSSKLVACVVPLALAIGGTAAYAFRRCPFPGSRGLEAIALAPLSLPGITLAFALIQTFGASPRFVLLAGGHLVYTVPLVIKAVSSGIQGLDRHVLEAARTLGATPVQRARLVVLPLLAPSLLLSGLLVFVVSWGEFNVSFLLATPAEQTYPAALYMTYTANSFPIASAATVLFLLPIVPILVFVQAVGGHLLKQGA